MDATIQDLREVETFVRVAELGSFTAASRRLGIPKSTASRRVTRLEDRLGVRLLQRTTRSLKLSAAGQLYYNQVSRLLQELTAVETAVAGLASHPRGPLRISAPLTFLAIFPELCFEFVRLYPDVRLEIALEDRIVDLVGEGFDLALRGGKPPDPSLEGQRILNSDMQLLASPEYCRRRGRPLEPRQLESHDCLVLGMGRPTIWTFESRHESQRVEIQARMGSNSVLLLLEAARQGLGIARLPTGGGGYNLQGLEVLLPDWTLPGGGLWLVYPSARLQSPAAMAFTSLLLEKISSKI